jgi:hypothetical protein
MIIEEGLPCRLPCRQTGQAGSIIISKQIGFK